MEYVMYC